MKNEVVVLIPHYNDAEGLEASVASIDENESVDLLIVDDGSRSSKINEDNVRRNFNANGEIIFLYQKENGGITTVLNAGLELIKKQHYKYIARLDSGDICIGQRFKLQSDYLKANPDIKLIGSNVIVTDMEGNFLYNITVPTNSKQMKNNLFVSSSSIIHPTIMFTADILELAGNYPTKYYTEDYAFYFEILKHFSISNTNDFLIKKELNPNSMSLKNRHRQASARLDVIKDNFYFGFYPIYGFIRNYILLIVPNKYLIQIKKLIYK